jgi:hypothetical protein
MREARNFLVDRCPETLDLFIWNRSPLSFISDETQHAGRPQYLKPLLDSVNNVDECITAEHRDFHLDPPVAPPVDLTEKGKERAHAFLLKLRNNPLFMPRQGVNRVPTRFLQSTI